MRHAVEIGLPLSVNMKVIAIPGGKDPDELFKTGGEAAVAAAVSGAVMWHKKIIGELPTRFDFSSPVGRSQAAAYMAELLKLVDNQVELESYVQEVSSCLGVSEEAIYSQLGQARRSERRRQEYAPKKAAIPASGSPRRYPAFLLTMLDLAVNADGAARMLGEILTPDELPDLNLVSRAINIAINCELNGESAETVNQINALLIEHPEPEISRILTAPESWNDVARAVDDTVREFRRAKREQRRRKIKAELNKTDAPEKRGELMRELLALSREDETANSSN